MTGCSRQNHLQQETNTRLCLATNEEFAERSFVAYEHFKTNNRSDVRAALERIRDLRASEPHNSINPPGSLNWEEGDTYPSIMLTEQRSFRLTPLMRRHTLGSIERIAINSNLTGIALIAKRSTTAARALLIIDPYTNTAQEVGIDAYDASWIDESSLLISERINQEPRVVHVLRLGESPRELIRVSSPAEHLLLRPSARRGYGLIEHSHPEWSFFEVIDSADSFRPRTITNRDSPSSSCVIMNESAFCSSFAQYPQGALVRIDRNRQIPPTNIYVAPVGAAITHLAPTAEGIAIFSSLGAYSTVATITSSGRLIRGPTALGPTTTLSATAQHLNRAGLEVTKRSFLTPTRHVSINSLSATSLGNETTPCESCSERSLSAVSADGSLVPISLVTQPDPHGLLVTAYGSYGVRSFAEYSAEIGSLARQGIAVAIAHVRGGGELGPAWHSSARGANKIRSVEDLSASITTLSHALRLPKDRIILYGRSAGAWLAAKTAISYQQTLGALILEAPLLDLERVVPDQSLPIYERERYEWGESVNALRLLSPSLSDQKLSVELLASIPMRDELVPVPQTLRWLREFECHQVADSRTIVSLVPGATHSGPTALTDIDTWSAVKEVFIRQVLEKRR